jgi:hypothetical protein
MPRILRGDIRWADLNPVRVREQMNNVPKTTSSLPKAPMLSADRVRESLAGGVLWVDPRGDRHF